MPHIESILLIVGLLFLISILASKASARFGVPSLLLFAIIGMLAGSDGPGGIYFDHPWGTQFTGVLALSLILFAAGFETDVERIRPVVWQGISLATVGVFASAIITGLFSAYILQMSWKEGLLLGAIISSTDAAAVFNVLRSKGLHLKGRLRDIIEFESGSNDPMAVLLTVFFIGLITNPNTSAASALLFFALQLGLGAALGYLFGAVVVRAINAIRLEWEGLYPVLSLTLALLTYSITAFVHGNGFLAVYIAGLVAGRSNIIHRTTLRLFHDGLAWLMQIAMFLVLGLQVYPSRLPSIALQGIAIAFFLMFIARPVSVFLALVGSGLRFRKKLLISWAGMRGAAPIVLATFPLLAGLERSGMIFDIVFFVALISLLLQGTTIPLVARWLNLQVKVPERRAFPLLFNPSTPTEGHLVEIQVEAGSFAEDRRLMDLNLPSGVLVVLVNRGNQFVVPQGSTVLKFQDTILMLSDATTESALNDIFRRSKNVAEQ